MARQKYKEPWRVTGVAINVDGKSSPADALRCYSQDKNFPVAGMAVRSHLWNNKIVPVTIADFDQWVKYPGMSGEGHCDVAWQKTQQSDFHLLFVRNQPRLKVVVEEKQRMIKEKANVSAPVVVVLDYDGEYDLKHDPLKEHDKAVFRHPPTEGDMQNLLDRVLCDLVPEMSTQPFTLVFGQSQTQKRTSPSLGQREFLKLSIGEVEAENGRSGVQVVTGKQVPVIPEENAKNGVSWVDITRQGNKGNAPGLLAPTPRNNYTTLSLGSIVSNADKNWEDRASLDYDSKCPGGDLLLAIGK